AIPMVLEQGTSTSVAERLLDQALRAGAQAAEVYVSRSLNRPILFETNQLKQIETRDFEGYALRLWKGGRPGLAVAYGAFEPGQLVETAIALSQLNDPEPFELTATPPTVCDAMYGQTATVQQMIDWGNTILSDLVTQEFADLHGVLELDCETATTALLNSEGLNCRYTDQTLSLYGAIEWVRGEDLLCVEAEQIHRNALDLSQFVASIQARLRWAQVYSRSPVGRLPILLTGKAAELLWTTVEAALNSKRVIEGASPWSDRLLDSVVSPQLTLLQNPHRGPFGCPFDDEGIETRCVEFIRNGILQLFYTDRTTGRLLGSGSTGNGFRSGLERYPSPGLFNLMILPGPYRFDELVAQIPEGLIVDQFLGEFGSISGDFAINVDLGYRVKDGQIIGRVKDTLVSGNVYQALNQVVAIGRDAEWYGSCYAPSILLEGLSVTA
ncbi:MAG: TldD/PmbA family protein, partial [Thermosynechococcaceae cyanobacterium]